MGDHSATTVKADALNRALRTLWVNIGFDVVASIGLGLDQAMKNGGDPLTAGFWVGIGALAVKSLVTSTASYLLRLKVAPKTV